MFKDLKLTPKLIVLCVVFGAVPMSIIGLIAHHATRQIEEDIANGFEVVAENLADKIDRNLFERYGDVQAFALNRVVYERAHWYQAGEENNPIVETMNRYVDTYDIYYLTLLVDLKGRLIAVNSRDAEGRPVHTEALYQKNYSTAPWFQAVAAGRFTRRMPFTAPGNEVADGTFIEDVHIDPDVEASYPGDAGMSLGFSAPVYEKGKVIAYWSNRARFSLVEDMFRSTYGEMEARGWPGAELTLLDKEGRILIDYDPARTGTREIIHDFAQVLLKFNPARAGVSAAQRAVAGEAGHTWSLHARKQIVQAAGYAHLKGALGYPGMNWSVLVRAPRTEALASVLETRRRIYLSGGIALVLIIALGLLIGRRAVRPLLEMGRSVKEFAEGRRQTRIAVHSGDEIGQLGGHINEMIAAIGRAQEEAQRSLREATMKAAIVENATVNILVANTDYTITYMNPRALKTFEAIEDVLPCKAGEILGKNIDFFHKDPSRQRRILADPARLPHTATIKLGHHTLDLTAAPLYDQRGDLAGMMATWELITERVRLEEEVKQQAEEARRRRAAAEEQRRRVLEVAAGVSDTSNLLAAAAEELSAGAAQLAQSSERQQTLVGNSASAVQQLAASARVVSDNAEKLAELVTENTSALAELASSVTSVTQNAGQMNQAVMSNSSAIEELAASIQTQAHSTEQANQTAEQANQTAAEGAQVVRQAIEGMERIAGRVRSSAAAVGELGKSSQQISQIVGVINDIADQTNLLALNAAIEAARAGEQGRGFAVVAEEVRNLAERTSKATQEIDEMIGRIQVETQQVVSSMEAGMKEAEEGTELAARSGEALEQIAQGVRQVNELMAQLSAATREQATTSDQIVQTTGEMNELVEQVTNAMGEQSQAVEVVSNSSEEMQQLVEQVTGATREQMNTVEQVARSMEEVNQVTQEGQVAMREMDRSTSSLADQAEELKQLAARFEESGEDESPAENGRPEQQVESAGRAAGS